MNFVGASDFFKATGFFSPSGGGQGVGEHQAERTLRLPSLAPSVAGATMALVLALGGATTTQDLPITWPERSSSEEDAQPSVEVLSRKVCLEGRWVRAMLEVERWPDGATVVRLAESSIFGEAASLSQAITALSENVEEFSEVIRAEVEGGAVLRGQARRDWEALRAVLGEAHRT